MTTDEAIRLNQKLKAESILFNQVPYKKAIELGIEALKRCNELLKYTSPDTYMPLPGETEEGGKEAK